MTTPRVTVPVEPTETMMKAADAVDWNNEDERASVINMWQAMLSAAPAPEGGAVDTVWRCAMTVACNIAIDEQNRTNDDDGPSEVLNAQGEIIRRLKEVLEIDRNYRSEVEAILRHGAEPFITAPSSEAALATREEAPAEAGEDADLASATRALAAWTDSLDAPIPAKEDPVLLAVAHLRGLADFNRSWTDGRRGDALTKEPVYIKRRIAWADYYDAWADAVLALRAQPPAREDAQPVAWRMIGRDGSTISLQAEPYHGGFAHMMESDVGCTVQPLYTHPALDALRVELELLEEVCARYADAEDAFLSDEGEPFGNITTECGMKARDARRRFRDRLAALQAEQKGGAA